MKIFFYTACCIFFTGCVFFNTSQNCIPCKLPDVLETAMRCIEVQEFVKARGILSTYLDTFPNSLDALLLYQDTFQEEQEKEDIKKRLASLEPHLQDYLLARQNIPESIAKMEALLLQKPLWHRSLCMDLVRAYLQKKEYSHAKKHLDILLSEKPCIPSAHLLHAWYSLHIFQWKEALYHARLAREGNPYLVKPYFFEAAQEMVNGNYFSSLQWFKKIRILFPSYVFEPDEELGYQSAFWRELSSLKKENLWRKGLSLSEEALKIFPKQSLFLSFKAEFLIALGKKEEAVEFLEKSLLYNPYQLRTVQMYRKILLEKDRYQKAFEIWQRLVPEKLLYHSDNKISPLYKNLRDAFLKAKSKDRESLLYLASSLESAGWEKEAKIVYEKIAGTEKEQKRLSQKIGFLEDLTALFSAYYDTGDLNIREMIQYINRIARRNQIPLLTYPSQELSSYFLVVQETNPFNPRPDSLGEYLAKCNKVLDLGNNYGHLDARLMNRISVCDYTYMEKNLSFQRIVGDETLVDTYLGYHSGSSKVAGRAFFSAQGFYVALDTLRPSLGEVKYLYTRILSNEQALHPYRRISKNNDNFLLSNALIKKSFHNIPLPDTEEKWDILYNDYLLKNLEIVHKHELGHITDFPCFLPLSHNLGNLFRMLWQNRFSVEKVHTRFESVADIYGVSHTIYPYYYLSQLLDRLDVNFSGLFEMVYWAWYGIIPEKDPYYQTSHKILQDIAIFLENKPLSQLPHIPKEKLHQILQKLYQKINNCE